MKNKRRRKNPATNDVRLKAMRTAYSKGSLMARDLHEAMVTLAVSKGLVVYMDVPTEQSVRNWLSGRVEPDKAQINLMAEAMLPMPEDASE